jgi:hypothetical protein
MLINTQAVCHCLTFGHYHLRRPQFRSSLRIDKRKFGVEFQAEFCRSPDLSTVASQSSRIRASAPFVEVKAFYAYLGKMSSVDLFLIRSTLVYHLALLTS